MDEVTQNQILFQEECARELYERAYMMAETRWPAAASTLHTRMALDIVEGAWLLARAATGNGPRKS